MHGGGEGSRDREGKRERARERKTKSRQEIRGESSEGGSAGRPVVLWRQPRRVVASRLPVMLPNNPLENPFNTSITDSRNG